MFRPSRRIIERLEQKVIMNKGNKNDTQTPACVKCGKKDNLMACAKCKTTQYCGRECQKADWKLHKVLCGLKVGQHLVKDFRDIVNAAPGGAKDHAIKKLFAGMIVALRISKGSYHVPVTKNDLSLILGGIWMMAKKQVPTSAGAFRSPSDREEFKTSLLKSTKDDAIYGRLLSLLPARFPAEHGWLHDRSDVEVRDLLTDAYRLFFCGPIEKVSKSEVDEGWLFFNKQADQKGFIPRHWSMIHVVLCVKHGQSETNKKNVYSPGEGEEVAERYDHAFRPMQLMVLASQISGLPLWLWEDDLHLQRWIEDAVFLIEPERETCEAS